MLQQCYILFDYSIKIAQIFALLLIIAVMFTFSFGSAFAATPLDSQKVTYDKAYSEVISHFAAMESRVLKAKNDALYDIFGTDSDAKILVASAGIKVTVEKAVVEKVYDKTIYTPAMAKIAEAREIALTKLDARKDKTSASSGTYMDSTYATQFATPSNVGKFAYFTTESVEWKDANGDYYPAYTDLMVADTLIACDADGDGAADNKIADINFTSFTGLFAGSEVIPADGTTKKDDVAKEVVKAAKAAAVTAIGNINLEVYSKEYNGEVMSNYDTAKKLVAKAQNDINAIDADVVWDDGSAADVTDAIEAIEAIYVAPENQADPAGALYTGAGAYAPGLDNITTIANEPTAEAKLAWAKAKAIAEVTDDIKAHYNIPALENALLNLQLATRVDEDAVKTAQDTLDTAKENQAAAIDVLTYLVNDKTALKDVIVFKTEAGTQNDKSDDTDASFKADAVPFGATLAPGTVYYELKAGFNAGSLTVGTLTTLEAVTTAKVNKIADLKDEAELLKATIYIDGTTAYELEAALADAIDEVYKAATETAVNAVSLGHLTAEKALLARMRELVSNATDIVINNRGYEGVANWDTADLRADMKDEGRAVKKETIYAIFAAKTIEEADAAYLAGLEKFEALPTAADTTVAQSTKAFIDLKTQYTKEILAYVNYKVAGLTAADVLDQYTITEGNKATFAAALTEEYLGNDVAFSTDDLTKGYNDAKAFVDNLKKVADLQADKKALEAEIKAFPTNPTVADKEALDALQEKLDDHNDYCAIAQAPVYKVTVGTLTTAATAIKNADDKALRDAYNAIMKDNKVTTDEAEAVKALRKAFNEYVARYSEEDCADGELAVPVYVNEAKLSQATAPKGVEVLLSEAQIAEVEAAIAKLPANPTAEQVKAARAAYDTLSLSQKVAVKATMYDKLVDAEKLFVMNDEAAKAYVQDLGIKARSTKTAKGVKITIKADVQELLDNGYTVEYKFYRSTKSNKGFKAMVTKTTGTYTNTKGVKGTKYFYKVKLVVKNAAGEVVATTPLTQCLYATRTF